MVISNTKIQLLLWCHCKIIVKVHPRLLKLTNILLQTFSFHLKYLMIEACIVLRNVVDIAGCLHI